MVIEIFSHVSMIGFSALSANPVFVWACVLIEKWSKELSRNGWPTVEYQFLFFKVFRHLGELQQEGQDVRDLHGSGQGLPSQEAGKLGSEHGFPPLPAAGWEGT